MQAAEQDQLHNAESIDCASERESRACGKRQHFYDAVCIEEINYKCCKKNFGTGVKSVGVCLSVCLKMCMRTREREREASSSFFIIQSQFLNLFFMNIEPLCRGVFVPKTPFHHNCSPAVVWPQINGVKIHNLLMPPGSIERQIIAASLLLLLVPICRE